MRTGRNGHRKRALQRREAKAAFRPLQDLIAIARTCPIVENPPRTAGSRGSIRTMLAPNSRHESKDRRRRMKSLLAFSRVVDAFNERLSYVANWLVLLSCLISAGNAFSRYAFSISSNAWLEIQW